MAGRSNTAIASVLAASIVGMAALSFAAVPLYRMFCQATAMAARRRLAGRQAPGASGGVVQVRFDANTNPGLPWRFTADRSSVIVPLGQDELASYTGRNQADRAR